jgi:hypothetical protein
LLSDKGRYLSGASSVFVTTPGPFEVDWRDTLQQLGGVPMEKLRTPV